MIDDPQPDWPVLLGLLALMALGLLITVAYRSAL